MNVLNAFIARAILLYISRFLPLGATTTANTTHKASRLICSGYSSPKTAIRYSALDVGPIPAQLRSLLLPLRDNRIVNYK